MKCLYLKQARNVMLLLTVATIGGSLNAATVGFRIEAVDIQGAPVSQVHVGQEFGVQVWVEDLRANPSGVFSAFLDVTYDPALLTLDETSFAHGSEFGVAGNVDLSILGELNEVGSLVDAANSIPPPLGAGEFVLFEILATAKSIGIAEIAGNPADILPAHATTLRVGYSAVLGIDQQFESSIVSVVVPEPSCVPPLLLTFGAIQVRARKTA